MACIFSKEKSELDLRITSAASRLTGDTAILNSTDFLSSGKASSIVSSSRLHIVNLLSAESLIYNLYCPFAQAVGDSTHPSISLSDTKSKKQFPFLSSNEDEKLIKNILSPASSKIYLSTAMLTVAVSSALTLLLKEVA